MEPDSWLTVTGSPKNFTSFPLVLGVDCQNSENSVSMPALDRLKFLLIIYHNNSRKAIVYAEKIEEFLFIPFVSTQNFRYYFHPLLEFFVQNEVQYGRKDKRLDEKAG